MRRCGGMAPGEEARADGRSLDKRAAGPGPRPLCAVRTNPPVGPGAPPFRGVRTDAPAQAASSAGPQRSDKSVGWTRRPAVLRHSDELIGWAAGSAIVRSSDKRRARGRTATRPVGRWTEHGRRPRVGPGRCSTGIPERSALRSASAGGCAGRTVEGRGGTWRSLLASKHMSIMGMYSATKKRRCRRKLRSELFCGVSEWRAASNQTHP